MPTVGWANAIAFTVLVALAGQACSTSTEDHSTHVKAGESIQKAINEADSGATIYVGPGTYAEQLTVDKDGICLIGSGAVLVPPAIPSNNTCSGLAGNDTQAGICVTGSEISLAPYIAEHRKVLSVGKPVKGVSITGFEVRNFTGQNIAVVGGKGTKVTKNTLIDGSTYGFLTVGSNQTLADSNVVNSTDTLRFIGLCMDDISEAEFSNNDIYGYFIALCIQTKGAIIKKNKVSNGCVGAFVDPGIEHAKVIGNHISASNPACAKDGPNAGIIVNGAKDSLILKNIVEGQKNGGMAGGIVVVDDFSTPALPVASGNVVKYNILKDNDYNIFVNTTGTGNVIENNNCSTPGPGCA